MYRKFDVTGNLFFLHSAFLEELNTVKKKMAPLLRSSAIYLVQLLHLFFVEAAIEPEPELQQHALSFLVLVN
jgi:hypothetical protein